MQLCGSTGGDRRKMKVGDEMFDAKTLELLRDFQNVIHDYSPDERAKISSAVEFAMWAHAGQKRDGGEVYINHPMRVAMYLKEALGVKKVDYIVAAVLHDVLEDTDVLYDELARRFGDGVAQIVQTLSKTKDGDMDEYFRRIGVCWTEVRMIKVADRINNLEDMKEWKADRKASYIKETVKYISPIAVELGPDVAEALASAVVKAKNGHAV